MTHLYEVVGLNLGVIGALVCALWLVSLAVRDASIVDIFWGAGFVVVAWTTAIATGAAGARATALLAMVTLWGVRLTAYLAWRNIGKGEDYRYRQMRARWGARFAVASLVIVFLLQGVLICVVSLPVQAGLLAAAAPLSWLSAVGVALWAIGMVFETVGDIQLARFKADPANADRGAVMDRGLWRYTRHPNYFGDFAVWWGLFAVAVPDLATAWTAVGPAVMSILLIRVSGVGLLERSLKQRPGYDDYIRRTSAFFPWPPRNR